MMPHSSQLCDSDNLELQGQRNSELNSLFLFLIESCLNHSSTEEQRSLAQYIEPMFTTAVEINPNTYNFLTPQLTSSAKQLERAKIVAKKNETPKSKKSKALISRQKSKKPLTPSTSKDFCPLVSTISPLSSIKTKSSSMVLQNSNSREDVIQRLLKAVELSTDELSTILLSRLLQGYTIYCKTPVSQKRLKRVVRLDAANYCLRAMRIQMADTNPSPLKIVAVDALAKALMSISVKDRKFMLKVRISGLLFLLANRILEADRLFTTVTLLRLTSRCLRSPRNAQLIGKERRFAERFVSLLNAFTATMEYPTTSSSSTSIVSAREFSFSFDEPLVSAIMQKTPESDNFIAAEKMARLVEILFFAAKNKHNKSQLLDHQAVCVLKTIFENHFERRHLDTIHLEISLISLATIRQFSKTKKGKEQLKELLILEMCEKYINLLTEDKRKLANRPKTLALYSQLQDSLCALCLRCLPQLPFPIAKQSFPLKFMLPAVNTSSTSENQKDVLTPKLTPSPQKRKSLRKQRLSTPTKHDFEDEPSSDDGNYDEEEDSLLFLSTSEVSPGSLLNQANETNIVYSDEDDNCNIVNSSGSKIDPEFDVCNYSQQSLALLKSNYQQNFIEIEQEAIATDDSSPKLRKTSFSSSSRSTAFNLGTSITLDKPIKSHQQQQTVISIAKQTKSVGKFVKIAYPDFCNLDQCIHEKQLLLPSSESMREMVVNELAKSRLKSVFKRRVVYDLDVLVAGKKSCSNVIALNNNDMSRISQIDNETPHLKFESRFESGNLRQAIQVSENHYELVLSPDINQQNPHYQWFYFEVSNNQADVIYTFEIINCLKNSSMFSRGMQPVLFSVTEANQGRPGWVRAATSVCYYRNLYTINGDDNIVLEEEKAAKNVRSESAATSTQTKKKIDADSKNYFSTRFTLMFCHAADVCYLAYHFPYTYSYLNATLESVILNVSSNSNIYIRNDFLTNSLAGNPIRLLTISASGSIDELKHRDIVLFSARVHPGESNSSWVMHGILKFLISNAPMAVKAREMFVFKIVPVLNPDGVINGSHRCSLAGIDLNRVWNNPSPALHPTIYHTKGIIQYLTDVTKKRPFAFVDLHGHSRRPNIFLYGNNPEESWRSCDHSVEHSCQFLALPEVLEKLAASFSLSSCRFAVTKTKEFSARIAMWRQFNLERAYTMEATYCGFDSGCYAGKQITILDLMEMGANLCEAVVLVKNAADNGDGVSGADAYIENTENEIKK